MQDLSRLWFLHRVITSSIYGPRVKGLWIKGRGVNYVQYLTQPPNTRSHRMEGSVPGLIVVQDLPTQGLPNGGSIEV